MGMIESVFFSVMVNKRSGWVFRKHAGFPQRGNPARIQASLSSPKRRGTVPAQPCSRFSQTPSLITVDALGMIEKKGTRYLFYKDCPQVETVLFFPEKAAYPLFIKR